MRNRFGLASLILLVSTNLFAACPFCSTSGKTFSDEVRQAQLILFGTMKNAKKDPKEFGKGTTDLHIEVLIKDDNYIKDQKVITLPRYLPETDPDKPTKWLVFCEIYKGQIDPYRGIPVSNNSKVAEYLQGAQKLLDKDPVTKLQFYFKYLDSDENDIANDALMEFGNADYKDVRNAAKYFSAKSLAKWLTDENTHPSRLGLYGSLLGDCGDPKIHSEIFKKILSDPKRRPVTGLDGIIAGYAMLNPKEGIQFLQKLFYDQKQQTLATGLFPSAVSGVWDEKNPGREEFLTRYAGLRAVRFFALYRPDLLNKKQTIELLMPLLFEDDICDLVMDDFRKMECWEYADAILRLYENPLFVSTAVVRRAIIRFALKVPNNPKAVSFIKARRAEDADLVQSVEELLDQEKPAASAPEVKK
ncbi:hypothetical protein KIH39_05625 [Telmatocola sphagniphila]|uniref:HEAT repeat domain-containing protein n=1 Tax=Telmatocola sphagniphila TaxID=1123043 RepID=A0A8E6B8M9_9BACT|nr:hypothetical protein [Telmatocola sphagniphila]QVL33392.1 hypothetical protein KIH39_05625 [Telmatocola sphagniphila]